MDQGLKRILIGYLTAAMDATRKDATNLAHAIGAAPSTLTRHLEADWKGGISAATLRKIEEISGVPVPIELSRSGDDRLAGRSKTPNTRETEGRAAVYRAPNNRDLIPVRSAARGGEEQEMFLEDGPVDYVSRPSVLENVKEAYAIYMVGDSMSPRYEPGFTLYINPFKPPRNGNGVVIYKTNGSVLVKRFKSTSKAEVVVEQLNPPRELHIPRSEIQHIHLVVHVDEVS